MTPQERKSQIIALYLSLAEKHTSVIPGTTGELFDDYYFSEDTFLAEFADKLLAVSNQEQGAFLLALYEDIKHGDEAHQAWLKEKIEAFAQQHEL